MKRARLAAVIAAGAVLFSASGCGHQPGTAIQVGDSVVRTSTINKVTDAQCRLVGASNTSVPKTKLVWAIVNALLLSEIQNGYGKSVGASYDVDQLRSQLAQVDQGTTALPSGERSDLRKAISDSLRGELIVQSVGTKALADKGVASPTQAEVTNAGNALVRSWAAKQDITVDPRYNVSSSRQAGAGDGSVSKAISTFAKRAASGSGNASFLADLPADQICG